MTNRPTDRQTPASYSSDYTRLKSTGANGSKIANKYCIQTKCKFDKMQKNNKMQICQNAHPTYCKYNKMQIRRNANETKCKPDKMQIKQNANET